MTGQADDVVASALQDMKLKKSVHLKRDESDALLTDFINQYGEGDALRDWLKKANEEASRYADKKAKKVKGEETEEPGTVDNGSEEDNDNDED